MSITVTKAKLTKKGCLDVSYVDIDGNSISMKGCNPVHSDLRKALTKLVPFLADLTEQKEAVAIDWDNPESVENEDLLHHLDVNGVTISGFDLDKNCTLTGTRSLMTSKVLNLCAPQTSFDAGSETYDRCEDLRDAVDAFLYEATLYVTKRKWSIIQKDIEFKDSDDPFAESDVPDSVTADMPIEEPEAIPA